MIRIDINNTKHLIAESGKGIVRKSDKTGPFLEVYLGMYNYGGIMRYETINDFEEIDLK